MNAFEREQIFQSAVEQLREQRMASVVRRDLERVERVAVARAAATMHDETERRAA